MPDSRALNTYELLLRAKIHALIREAPVEDVSPHTVQPSFVAPGNSTEESQMANLIPRDTLFRDLFDVRRNFDQAFNRFLSWPSTQEDRTLDADFSPAVESFIDTDNKKFHCEVLLPGVDPKNVNIQVQGNTLTISGERTNTRETKEANFVHREISYGSFTRTLVLPKGIDKDKITAEYSNVMLEITAPIANAALQKSVHLKSITTA